MNQNFSKAEQAFYAESGSYKISSTTPYLLVDNFPKLGLLSALSFLEWAINNPEGVVTLPIGKTALHFLNNTQLLLDNWSNKRGKDILDKYGLSGQKKPDLRGLQLVQAGEFYPISSTQHNSLWNYLYNYYIKGFGLDESKALLINSDQIELVDGKHFSEVFPDFRIDLSLRFREAKTQMERVAAEIFISYR
jgi:glucosamine-6-phosphate deaminase